MNNSVCPYTLQPVDEIRGSREHVIPDALGGPNGFAVRACATANSEWGHTIDAAFINSDIMRICASRIGLKSRSGLTSLKLRGELTSDGSPVDVTLSPAENEFRIRSPIVKDESGELVGVRGYGEQAKRELDRVVADLRRKGKTVEVGLPNSVEGEVHAHVRINARDLALGLIKIGYLANVWMLGDDFTRSKAGAVFRDRLSNESESADLRTADLPYAEITATLAPGITDAHHFICSIRGNGTLTTLVRLFNEDLLSANFVVEAPDLPAARQDAILEFLLVDASNGTIQHSGPMHQSSF